MELYSGFADILVQSPRPQYPRTYVPRAQGFRVQYLWIFTKSSGSSIHLHACWRTRGILGRASPVLLSPRPAGLKQGLSCCCCETGSKYHFELQILACLLQITASSNAYMTACLPFPSLSTLLRLRLICPTEHRLWFPFSNLPGSLNHTYRNFRQGTFSEGFSPRTQTDSLNVGRTFQP